MASIIQPPNAAMNARRSSGASPRIHCVMTPLPMPITSAGAVHHAGSSLAASLRGVREHAAAVSRRKSASPEGDCFATLAMTGLRPTGLSAKPLGELIEVARHDIECAGGHLVRFALRAPFERARDIAGAQALLGGGGEIIGVRRHQH